MNESETNKMTSREAWKLNMRCFRLWWDRRPSWLLSIVTHSILQVVTPYVGIYFSAQVMNELAGNRDPQELMRLVLLTLCSAAVLAVLTTVSSRWQEGELTIANQMLDKIYADKELQMDFCSMDSQEVQDTKNQIEQTQNYGGYGIFKPVYQDAPKLISALTGIIGAIVLTVSLFTQKVPESGGALTVLNHPIFIVVLAAVMLVVTILAPVLATKADQLEAEKVSEGRAGNRWFSYYGFHIYNKAFALDMRLYNQQKLCEHYFGQERAFSIGGPIEKMYKGRVGFLNSLSKMVSASFTGVAYLFVCLKAWGGAFGIGSVTQYIGAITALSRNLGEGLAVLGSMKINAEFLEKAFGYLDIPNDMYQGSLTVEKRRDCNYEIEFRDVSFRYPGAQDDALSHLSMKFKVGERLAVVGENGSGKTTFIKLLCRLYDPTEGKILLNGIDIRKYSYREYMDIFAIVFQDLKLLSFSLGQNVAARVDYDPERAEKCLKEAGFEERLSRMPKGLETNLYKDFDKEGVEVSGGEAQKIAIARALYKDAPFIILDEPTAALDPKAEYEIYTKFNELVGDKTAIYISHRLSSCRFCSNIAVFEKGRVVQQGSHEELVEQENGKYHQLWYAQAQYYQ